jgi:hypothetical protein
LNLAKRNLVAFKLKHNIPISLVTEDIVPIVNFAWKPTFGNNISNKKAIAVRGWNPFNRNLLLNKEICNIEEQEHVEELEEELDINNDTNGTNTNKEDDVLSDALVKALNSINGNSGSTFQKIVQYVLRNGGIEKNREDLARGEAIQATLQQAKRVTSGVMIKHKVHEVNNPNVQKLIKDNHDRIKSVEAQSKKKKRNEIKKRKETINRLRLTKPDMNCWNMKDCKDFIQFKKKKGDCRMPSTLPLLRQRCLEVQGRRSPDCSFHESDDSDDEITSSDDADAGESDFINFVTSVGNRFPADEFAEI